MSRSRFIALSERARILGLSLLDLKNTYPYSRFYSDRKSSCYGLQDSFGNLICVYSNFSQIERFLDQKIDDDLPF